MNVAIGAASVVLILLTAACGGGSFSSRPPPSDPTEGRLSFERESTFDGEVLRLELPREDGGTESFNTLRDTEYTQYWPRAFIPNHAGRRWWLMKTTTEGTSLVYAVVSWDNDDPTDYLAIGYWLHLPGEHPDGFRYLTFANARNYPFFDGPEFDPAEPPRLPAAGEATYAGRAQGLYTYRSGGDETAPDDPGGVAEFQGTLTLTANFEDGTLEGCMGCLGDIETDRFSWHVALQQGWGVGLPAELPTDYELHFGETDIRPDGTFEDMNVEVRHPAREVAGSEGYWGGIFSNLPDADGNPRLVFGQTTVTFENPDGGQGEFDAQFTGLGRSLLPSAGGEIP